MVKGLVSVIIPVYNAEKFIRMTVQSALDQTYENIEILLIDDCSTDKSAKIINEVIQEKSKVRYYRLNENSGVAIARNKGIELAEGQYIAFLDSDDLWKPEKIKKEINLLNEVNGDFAFTSIEMIDEIGEVVKRKRKVRKEINYEFLLTNTMIATSSVLLDISKIGKFQMPLIRSGQDYATWLMLLRDGRVAYGIDEALTQYRRTKDSLSSKKTKNWKKVWDIQVNFEGIKPISAYFNCFLYAINALKKYFL